MHMGMGGRSRLARTALRQWAGQGMRRACATAVGGGGDGGAAKGWHGDGLKGWRVEAAAAVPASVARPPFTDSPPLDVKDARALAAVRRTCALAAQLLSYAESVAVVGRSTAEVDALLQSAAVAAGAYPSPLHYRGFPRASCTSVNHVICHGIPDSRPLAPGDLLNVDVTVYREGVHGDTSRTFLLPTPDSERAARAQRLLRAARAALAAGLSACRPGNRVSHIAAAVEEVARAEGVSVVPELLGHGIGAHFHEPPMIFHTGPVEEQYDVELVPGMVFTVEPCITEGSPEFEVWDDGWTIATRDRGLSAVFEHTIVITDSGHDVLTQAAPTAPYQWE